MPLQCVIFDGASTFIASPHELNEQDSAVGRLITFDDALRLVLALKAAELKLGVVYAAEREEKVLQSVPIGAFAAREREINAAGGDMDGSIDSGMDVETFGESPIDTLHIPVEATLLDMFDAMVSERGEGGDAITQAFLKCAQQLGVPPQDCIVITDAASSAQAAQAGAMHCIGIARQDDEASLRAAGVDFVVTSLEDVEVERLLANT